MPLVNDEVIDISDFIVVSVVDALPIIVTQRQPTCGKLGKNLTGKLDVREVAARLPEESVPDDPGVGDDELAGEDESADVEAAA